MSTTVTGILSDREIMRLCENKDSPLISPFSKKLTEVGKISHGLSSFGYDAILAPSFKIMKDSIDLGVIDPKDVKDDVYEAIESDHCILPPHGFMLGHTTEYFNIPEDIIAICLAKSTYARVGCVVGVTPLEAGWSGQVTIEISNTTPLPIKIYANEGICQFLFFKSTEKCITPYNKRGGKYMHQEGIVLSKIVR